jgi:hypothetical protein
MTDRIAEIRVRYDDMDYPRSVQEDIATLLAALDDRDREIERLRAALARVLSGVMRCTTCRGDGGVYDDDGVRAPCPESDCDDGLLTGDAAYRRGAESMREACAVEADQHDAEAELFVKGGVLRILARDIRALPIPEPSK